MEHFHAVCGRPFIIKMGLVVVGALVVGTSKCQKGLIKNQL